MNNRKFGFTLIEILVVVSIIALLAGLALTSFSQPQKQANDTIRKSDLKQYAILLKEYAANNSGFYPCEPVNKVASIYLCTDLGLEWADCPKDPKNGTTGFDYYYSSGTAAGGACKTQPFVGQPNSPSYVLYALIEATSATQFVVCSNGKSGALLSTAVHDNGVCPL